MIMIKQFKTKFSAFLKYHSYFVVYFFNKPPIAEGRRMSTAIEKASHSVQRAAVGVIVDRLLKQLDKDREKTFMELIDLAEKFW